MKCDVWKPRSDQRWQNELRFSIWRLFEQSSFVIIHLLCYWPPVHNSVLKICPKFQVLRSHFFDVNELLDEHCAKWKYFDSNLYRMRYDVSIKGLRSKNSRTSRLPVIFNLKNPSTTVQYAKKSVAGCEIRRFIYCFFEILIHTNGLVVTSDCTELGDLGSIPDEKLNRSAAPLPFCVALTPSVH